MWRSVVTGLGLAVALGAAAPVQAQDMSAAFNLGYFTLKSVDSRANGDVLNANRCIDASFSCEPLLFEVNDFNNVTIGGEWIVGLGDYFEVSAGIGYYQRAVPSVYENLTNENGSEIEQELKLRTVPITGLVRFVPTGRAATLQPLIGVGVGVIKWKYSETGSFVDTSDGTVFNTRYLADGSDVGPVVLGGLRGRVSDNVNIGGEVRYQWAEGSLSDIFVGDKIDLGGFTYQATFQVRF